PAFPIAAWWGETNVTLPFLASLLPGAYAAGIFFIPFLAICLLLPNDVLISGILGWFIFGVLYQSIGVATGIVPYKPGMEFVWPWEDHPGFWMPFPYKYIRYNGFVSAVIVWMLYKYRRRVVDVFSTLWKRDIVEQGLSMRLVTILMLVGFFGWYALMLAEQADPLIALLVPILALIFGIWYARMWSEFFWFAADWGLVWDPAYQLGVYVRGWPSEAGVTWDNPNTNPAWMTINRHITNISNWNVGFSPLSSGSIIALYKLAHDVKMRMKDLLIAVILGSVIFSFVAMPLTAFFVLHTKGGLNATNAAGGSWWPWMGAGRYHRGRWLQEGITPSVVLWLIYGVGFLVGILIYILKTRLPFLWFLNVVGLVVGEPYGWMSPLIALVAKYLIIRTIGVKKYEQYAMPLVSGWILGFGATWLPAALVNLVTVTIPRMSALYIP
ncbi:MAG: hypothetical protein NZ954_05700, partial [Thermofilaceae archaeon]|nr:hypothetical protein [Thermofilaceae archaeon]